VAKAVREPRFEEKVKMTTIKEAKRRLEEDLKKAKQEEERKTKTAEPYLDRHDVYLHGDTVGMANAAPSLLEKIQAKKRLYMDKVVDLDRLEKELIENQIERRYRTLEETYTYI
jgi:hypothetical protein